MTPEEIKTALTAVGQSPIASDWEKNFSESIIQQIDKGKTVKVPSGKGKYIVVVAPENPTSYNKNQGRIAWMVKQ